MPDENTKFVNSLFLKNLIENQYGESDVKIKSYTNEPASGGDVKALSSLNRILVKYSSKETPEGTTTFVAKIKPLKGELSEEFKNSDVFQKEISVYKTVLPAVVKILKKAGGDMELAPELIHITDTPTDILILEDLTARSYSTENPKIGLNLEQSKMALEKLAFFHAASVIMLNNDKDQLAKFAKGTFHEEHKQKLTYFAESFRTVIDSAGDLGIEKEIAEKLRSLPVIRKAIEDYNSTIKGFQVLNHGDFWTNNILFKFDGANLVDALFIDFQNTVVGSPIIDLMFFLTTSVDYNVLSESKDALIYVYHDTLSLVLQKLGYAGYVPTLNELQIEFLKRGSLEVIYTLTAAPYLRTINSQIAISIQPDLARETKIAELKNVLKDQKPHIIEQLKKYESQGLLDWGVADSKIKGLMGRFQNRA